MLRFISKFVFLPILAFLCACGGSGHTSEVHGDTLTSQSQLLTLVRYDSLYTVAEIANPWKEGEKLGRFILVDRNKRRPLSLPEGTVIEVPLKSTVVYSIVHQEAIAELGALDCIRAVADSEYITDADIIDRMSKGTIRAIGSTHKPNTLTIKAVNPDAILVSPYENNYHKLVYNLGIPVIECADYMEASPLARAEWILLLGELYGKSDEAMKVYSHVQQSYRSLSDSVKTVLSDENHVRPRVITEMVTQGVWYLPGGQSYMAKMLSDAGADYPWANTSERGSISLNAPTVLNRAQSADFWFIRTNFGDITEQQIRENCPLNSRFKAFITGNVYGCNTSVNNIYNDVAFHPDRVLRDYIIILHPEILPGQNTTYFKRMQR